MNIKAIADKLWTVRSEIATVKESIKETVQRLEEKEAALEAELIQELKANDLRTVKIADGTVFSMGTRFSLKVKDAKKALTWAIKNGVVRIDAIKALPLFRKPDSPMAEKFGMEVEAKDFLSVRRLGE